MKQMIYEKYKQKIIIIALKVKEGGD